MTRPRTTPPPRKKPRNPNQHQGMDDLCKAAMEQDDGRLLELIFTPGLCERLGLPAARPRLLEILPTELRRKRLHADYLLRVEIGGVIVLLHLEFQNRVDPHMGRRVAQYQVAVMWRYDGLPIYSVVFNMVSRGEQAVQVQTLRCGSLQTQWVEVTVPKAAKEWGSQVASPMGVLLAALLGDPSDDELNRCFERLRELGLSEETCRELLEALCFLLDVRQQGPREETRKRLFMKMRMQETWLYQEGRTKGVEEGVEKGVKREREKSLGSLRQAALELCRLRFGADEKDLERIRQIGEPGLLTRLIVRLGTAASLPEALSLLSA